ncbi:MAG: 16S rRNA (cytosine(1402)-N(4))-methyltransferase RsmH [Clostridia bacterium]
MEKEKIEKTQVDEQNCESEQQEHKRRVRYNGTHPRSFQEKYKELNPQKYQDDVAKIIQQGKTPAGMHIPICVNEIVEFLQIKPGQVGLDATLGYGGHTQRMLECLQGQGHLFATDVDPIESEKTKARLQALGFGEDILTIKRMNFANLDEIAPNEKFDFILADLGVSSMQIDNPERGFTYKRDGKLDLRLDPTSGETAAERLRQLNYMELVHLFVENSDEPYAEQIAKGIMRTFNKGGEIETTRQLYAVIEEALAFLPKKDRSDTVKKSCQRVFQALRIEINSEFAVLEEFLEKLPKVLKVGGRVAILTFHSGEDRLVKKAFKAQCADGEYSQVARDVIRPSMQECNVNPRAHSTKMRWAIK